jgi:hypothetical protein
MSAVIAVVAIVISVAALKDRPVLWRP